MAELDDVFLYSVDDLAEIVKEGLDSRQGAVAQAEAIIDSNVVNFMHWLESREVVPAIRALRDQAEQYRRHELDRAKKLLAKGEDPQKILESLSNGLTNKFLHIPSYALNHAARTSVTIWSADQPPVPPPPSRMKKSMTAKLTQFSVRLEELNRLLSSETVTANLDKYRKLTRERAEIAPVVELKCVPAKRTRHTYRAGNVCKLRDVEIREFADVEMRDAKEKLVRFGAELQKQLLPRDPNDERNIFLEIRAGTGGDESALFAGDCSVCIRVLPSASTGRSK